MRLFNVKIFSMNKRLSLLVSVLIGSLGSMAAASAATIQYQDPGTVNTAQYSFTATGGDVIAYFAGSIAAYDDRIGLIGTTVYAGPSSGVLDNQQSKIGDSYNFGSFAKGTVLSFYFTAQQSEQTFFSDNAKNPDGVSHIFSSATPSDGGLPAGVYVGVEDLSANKAAAPLQTYTPDFDYNDTQFVLKGVTLSTVPLPASAPMFGAALLALGAVGYGVKRKKAAAAT